MKGSLSDCLVERGLSGTWALGPALPPLLLESALAHFPAGPSKRFEGLCPSGAAFRGSGRCGRGHGASSLARASIASALLLAT